MDELYDRIRDQRSGTPMGIHYRIGLLARILEKSVLIGFDRQVPPVERIHSASLAVLCDRLQRGGFTQSDSLPVDAPLRLREIYSELEQYGASLESPGDPGTPPPPPSAANVESPDLFLPNAFRSGQAVIYALKLTLAAILCYVLYN